MTEPVVAAIGLGGNVGNAAATLRQAAQALDALPGTRLLRLSRLYRTPAWGVEDQPDFVNAVALVQTALAPRPLLEALLEVERRFGRDRARERRWGPRTLDLDVLLYGAQVIDEPGLQLPHPRLHLRAFALAPLLEVAPDAEIPGFGPARNAASAMDMSNIHPL